MLYSNLVFGHHKCWGTVAFEVTEMITWKVFLRGGLQPLFHGDSLDFQPHAEPQRNGFWLQYFWSTLTLWFSMKVFPGWALRSQHHADSFHTALLYVPSKAFLLLNLLVTGFLDEATHRSSSGFLVYKKSVGEVFILQPLAEQSRAQLSDYDVCLQVMRLSF